VTQIRLRGRRRHEGISGGDQSEQEDEAEEQADEQQVDAECADEDYEADHAPVHRELAKLLFERFHRFENLHCEVVEDLRRLVGRSVRAAFSRECRRDSVDRVLIVRERTPVGSVDDEDREGER
jgi:hypothetical protein